MNNIYVDELPKSCFECKCAFKAQRQQVNEFGSYMEDCMCCIPLHKWIVEKHRDCPLKPLTDPLAEERKKVCDYLRKELNIRPNHPYISVDLVSQENFFQNILDQIEGVSDARTNK